MSKPFSKDVYASKVPYYLEVFHHFKVDFAISNTLDDPMEYGRGENVVNIKSVTTNEMDTPADMYVYNLEEMRIKTKWINGSDEPANNAVTISYWSVADTFQMNINAPFEPVVFDDVRDLYQKMLDVKRLRIYPLYISRSCEYIIFSNPAKARNFSNILHEFYQGVKT